MNSRIVVLALLLAAAGYAQTVTTAEIAGTVIDPDRAVIPAATIVLYSVDTGESRSALSNASGVYRFVFVKPGAYELSAMSTGLRSDTGRLVAAVGQVEKINLTLNPEQPREVVLVTDGAPLLNDDNANTTYTVSQRELELLPLPGGDLTGVVDSIPGVVLNNRSGNGNFASQGLGSMSNLFTLNGVDNMDPLYNVNNSGASGLLLGANEIREVSIVQNSYEGQYGRQAGTQVNYVSKSGTNAFHGNLLYRYNDTIFNANDFFNNSIGAPRPKAVSNQYGAATGGRIIRDKLFFFANTEGLRFAEPGGASVVVTPSQALESYTLKTVQPTQVPLYQKMFQLYNAAPGHQAAVSVTNGFGSLQDSTGALGCGALAGTPTGTGGFLGRDVSCAQAWGTTIASQTTEWLISLRLDYNLSPHHRVFFRFKSDHGFLPVKISVIDPAFNVVSHQPDYEGQFNYTYIVTPRLVNNFIGSANYNDYVSAAANLTKALQLFPVRLNILDGGTNASSVTSMGAPPNYPVGRRAGQFQLIDDLSYIAGRHSLKAGVNHRYYRLTTLTYSPGAYEGLFTVYGLGELASGVLDPASGSSYFQLFSRYPKLHLHLQNFAAYIQDQWAVTPDLKVSTTLRIDRNSNPECLDRCFARLNAPFSVLPKGLSIPYDQSIQNGLANPFYHGEPAVFQPRLGVVYNPGWSKRTVVRGGVGLFSDSYPALFIAGLAGNAPNVFFSNIREGTIDATGADSAAAIAAESASVFQNGFANGATLPQLQKSVAPAVFSAPAYFSLPSAMLTPKYLEWSFEIQEQLGANGVFTARYAGNHGYDIFLVNKNANASANPALYPNGFPGLPAVTPDPRFQAVSQLTNNGFSNYDAMIVSFRRAFARCFQGQISYVWSHALDTISNGGLGGLVSFSYDSLSSQISPTDTHSLSYSNADYDIRHQLTGDFVWDIPVRFRSRPLKSVLSGWTVATRLNVHTGMPFSVINGRLGGRLSPSFGGTILADATDPRVAQSCDSSAVAAPCFTAAQFASTNTQTDLGNRPRNSFRGPGSFSFDSSLYKIISVSEGIRFTFGMTAYNVFNHQNFSDPNANVAGPGFGLITFTAPSPSGPYGWSAGPSGRALVLNGRLDF